MRRRYSPEHRAHRLQLQLEALGYKVTLEAKPRPDGPGVRRQQQPSEPASTAAELPTPPPRCQRSPPEGARDPGHSQISGGLLREGGRRAVGEGYSFIAAEKTNFPVAVMCRVLGVSRTGFHNWERRAPSDRALTDAWLTEKIRQIHDGGRGVYGAPRIHAELRLEHDIRVGRKRVARLMKAAGIAGGQTPEAVEDDDPDPRDHAGHRLVERHFRPDRPNALWVADITYLRTGEGWLYLAAVQDAYSRVIVGWSMATHMRASLVVDALQMALGHRRPDPGLIHDSDSEARSTSRSRSAAPRTRPGSRSRWAPAETPTTRAWFLRAPPAHGCGCSVGEAPFEGFDESWIAWVGRFVESLVLVVGFVRSDQPGAVPGVDGAGVHSEPFGGLAERE